MRGRVETACAAARIAALLSTWAAAPCRADDDLAIAHETYLVIAPDEERDLGWTPVLWADAGLLHVETRFGYEGLDVGTVLAGVHVLDGESATYDLQLMAGVSFGATLGTVTAYRVALAMGTIDLASEGELFLDLEHQDAHFLYAWTELGWSPTDWLRVGGAVQRTRVIHAGRDVLAGPFAGVSWRALDATLYLFGLGADVVAVLLLGVSS